MGGVGITAIYGSGSDYPDRRCMFEHGPDLHRRGMGSEQDVVVYKKSILHVPGRVILGEIQCFEVVIVQFNLRTLGNLETKTGKDLGYFFSNEGNRMLAPCRTATSRESDIYPFTFETFRFLGITDFFKCILYLVPATDR